MSILKLDTTNYNNLIELGHADAIDQIDMAIYKRAFDAGKVKFRVNVPHDSFLYVQIYLIPNMSSKILSCAGEEFKLTKKFFASCEDSSHLPNFDCKAGFTGLMEDTADNMFHLDNQGAGGWLQVNFTSPVKPTRIRVVQPSNFIDMVSKLEIK